MRRPDRFDLVILGLGACGALVDPRDPGEPRFGLEFVFSLGLWTLLGLVIRQAAATVAAAVAERWRERVLRGIDPAVAAEDAVRRERERLAGELDACIRQALEAIRKSLEAFERGEDPGAVARRIHLRSREATSELRRQLGLLRQAAPAGLVESTRASPARGVTGWTVALTLVAMVLSAVDAWAGSGLYGPEFYPDDVFRLPWSGLLGIAAAATLIGWRLAPALSAVVVAALLVVPREAGDVMVSAGFGLLVAVGCLTWSLAGRGLREFSAVAATVLLAAATVGSRLRDDPLNAGFLAAVLGVAWLVGFVVGYSRRRRVAAIRQARAWQTEVDAARDLAVQSERLAVARELHDVVSHAVGVIAMQAAAAQVSWPADPETALRAFDTIDQTASQALADLDRVVPDGTAEAQRDLDALVDRIRATGTSVVLRRGSPIEIDGVVFRIVQEGLTNVVRHAEGASVEVLIDADEDRVTVRVVDSGPGPKADTQRGFGLVGLAERVQLQGGTLRTGPGSAGRGFALEASLPRRPVEVQR